MPSSLRRWLYLDRAGIDSLYGQIVGERRVQLTRSVSESSERKRDSAIRVGVYGNGGELGREHSSGERLDVSETIATHDEGLLLELEKHFAETGGLRVIQSGRGVAEAVARGTSEYVTGILPFRWQRTHHLDVVEDARKKQMLEFVMDRDSHEQAGMVGSPVVMGGSLAKCVDRGTSRDGTMSLTSHLAIFLRQFEGDAVLRLGFIAHLTPLPNLVYLKPYGIWYP